MKIITEILLLALMLSLSTGINAGQSQYVYERIDGALFYSSSHEPVDGIIAFNESVAPPFGQFIVEVTLKNTSPVALDLDRATYAAIKTDGTVTYLTYEDADTYDVEDTGLKLMPGKEMIVYCRTPISNREIKKIVVNLTSGDKIQFDPRSI